MDGVIVREAVLADAVTLGTIGPAAYTAAYGDIWDSAAALAAWLDSFSMSAFERFLQRNDTRVWIAEIDGRAVGFLTMIIGSPDPVTKDMSGAEIPRIYLLPGAQALGLGKRLVDAAIAEARRLGLSHVWLDHMASADHARHAYLKWGFVELGTWTFNQPVKPGFEAMGGLIYRL